MTEQKIIVPNIGDFKEVEVIEVLVKEGQEIKKDESVITLESDKSSVEVPSNFSGIIKKVNVKVGDKVSEGNTILLLNSKEDSMKKTDSNIFGGCIVSWSKIDKYYLHKYRITEFVILGS